MGLKNLVIATETVMVPNADGSMEPVVVRGLGVEAILMMLRSQEAPMRRVFEMAVNGQLDPSNESAFAMLMLEQSGELVALGIAYAAGELDAIEKVMDLPLGVQIELVQVDAPSVYRPARCKQGLSGPE